MAKIPIFQDSILYRSVIDKDLDQTIKNVLQDEMQNKKGNILSNKGGYQTQNIKNDKICNTLLIKSSELITESYNLSNVKISILNLWINQNNKGNYNKPHTHPGSIFSGVYYVQISEKDGDLIFYRGDRSNQMPNIINFERDIDFKEEYHIQPLKNQLIIFPSYLLHMVTPHFEDISRISVSFNINIEPHG